LIFPGSLIRPYQAGNFDPPSGARLEQLHSRNLERLVVLTGSAMELGGRSSKIDPRPQLIFFYGNAMSLCGAAWELDLFRSLGCDTWIPDYVGYGLSSGKPSEAGCRDTADAVFDHLTGGLGIPANRIFVAGWSLGAAVAIDLAARRPVAGLVALSPFTSIEAMAHRLFPRWLPVSRLLNDHFDNARKITCVRCPILIAHGRRDRVVPFTMGQSLAHKVQSHGRASTIFVAVEGADHNDILTIGDPGLLNAVGAFFGKVSADESGHRGCGNEP
jgi:pimeloyl-ACP methyl ester carboxylesterase